MTSLDVCQCCKLARVNTRKDLVRLDLSKYVEEGCEARTWPGEV